MGVAPFDLYSPPVTRASRVALAPRPKQPLSKRFWQTTLEGAFVFLVVLVFTYGLSVLSGKSYSEKARRDAFVDAGRYRAARLDLGALQQRHDLKANPRRVGDWARTNGFERDSAREASE